MLLGNARLVMMDVQGGEGRVDKGSGEGRVELGRDEELMEG